MESITLAFNTLFPLFLMIGLGYLLRRIHVVDAASLETISRFIFRVLIPVTMFNNIYSSDLSVALRPKLMLFAFVMLTLFYLCFSFLVPRVIRENSYRGPIIQAAIRGNIVFLGIPIVSYIVGPENIAPTSILIALSVPYTNILSVVALETHRGRTVSAKQLIKSIFSNPLLLASLAGIFVLVLRIRFPDVICRTISDIARIGSPLALIVLGGLFEFSKVGPNKKPMAFGLLLRMVFVPIVGIPLSVLLGFRGDELAPLMVLFAAPPATTTYIMASQMGGDGPLAGQLVVFSTVLSMFTLFICIFFLNYLGYF